MAILSANEILDIVLMSLVVGFIFKDFFGRRVRTPDDWLKNVTPGFKLGRLSNFWYAVLLVAPSIILHELGHKFTAIAFGLEATFHAAYGWLVVGVLMKLFLPGFVFFVPAYVSFPPIATNLQHMLIAFAGPGVNLALWLASKLFLRFAHKPSHEALRFAALFARINGFLFLFNMLPLPLFDGHHFFMNLLHVIS